MSKAFKTGALIVSILFLGPTAQAQDEAVPSRSDTERVSKALQASEEMGADLARLAKLYQGRYARAPQDAKRQLDNLQREAAANNWTFQPAYTSVFGHDVSKMTGLRLPPNALELAKLQNQFANEAAKVAPKRMAPICNPQARKFNLRSIRKVSPVENQGQCGSCWAFASAAVLEFCLSARRWQKPQPLRAAYSGLLSGRRRHRGRELRGRMVFRGV